MDRQSRGSAAVNGQIELSQPTAGEAVGDHLQQLARQEARAFVLWHGLDGSGATLLFRAAAGLGLGLLYRGSRSLIPPVLCHWVLNVALVA